MGVGADHDDLGAVGRLGQLVRTEHRTPLGEVLREEGCFRPREAVRVGPQVVLVAPGVTSCPCRARTASPRPFPSRRHRAPLSASRAHHNRDDATYPPHICVAGARRVRRLHIGGPRALTDVPALAIAFYRCALASAVLLPLGCALRHRDELRHDAHLAAGSCSARGSPLAVHFATWVSSLSYTSIAASRARPDDADLGRARRAADRGAALRRGRGSGS